MAPSSGHLLVGNVIKLVRYGVEKASRLVRDKLPQVQQASVEHQVEPIYARITNRYPTNRLASIRQTQSQWHNVTRRLDYSTRWLSTTTTNASRSGRASYPSSSTARRVAQLTTRAPFASTLRPNLTGGTLSRTAGGYNIGAGRVNGARYFSHTPASAAEVVANVSQAVRAFYLSGSKARFDGHSSVTGEKRFRVVSELQDRAWQCLDTHSLNASGSFIDFKVTPIITAIGPLSKVTRSSVSTFCGEALAEEKTVDNINLLSTLEVDFARALKDLAAIMNDLKHLSIIGSLPIELITENVLRVRFPGCDRDTVENLCRELNIRRGIVGQDEDFDTRHGTEMALMFPYAPSTTHSEAMHVVFENENTRPQKRSKREHLEWDDMLLDGVSNVSRSSGQQFELIDNPWLSTPSGYSSIRSRAEDDMDVAAMFFQPPPAKNQFNSKPRSSPNADVAYEGVAGIYKFLEECDRASRFTSS